MRELHYHDLLMRSDGTVVSAFDPHENLLALDLIQPDDRVVVAGAGLGSVAASLALKVGSRNILCYEPNWSLLELAETTVKVDKRPLNYVHAALGAKTNKETFFVSKRRGSSSLEKDMVPDATESYEINVVGVNEALSLFKATGMVLDVEGTEAEILNALTHRLHWLVVEMHGEGRYLDQLMRARGWRFHDRMSHGWGPDGDVYSYTSKAHY